MDLNRTYIQRIDLLMAQDRSDVELTNAITKAGDTAGKIIHACTKDSGNQTVQTIGKVITTTASIARLSSTFQQACQFGTFKGEMVTRLEQNNKTVLNAYVFAENKASFAAKARSKTRFSNAVNQHVDVMQDVVGAKTKSYINNIIADPISKGLNVQVNLLVAEQNNEANKRQTQELANQLKEVNYTFLASAPPRGDMSVESNKFKPKVYTQENMAEYIKAAAEVPQHVTFDVRSKQSSAMFRTYSKNLESDPYGLFELPLIADKENVAIRVFDPKFKVPKNTMPNNVRALINVVEGKIEFEAKTYSPVQYTQRTAKGKPIPSCLDIKDVMLSPQNTLMFSVLYALHKKAPSHKQIDDYRHELANSSRITPKPKL
jgi:hypothetical protein